MNPRWKKNVPKIRMANGTAGQKLLLPPKRLAPEW